MRIVHGILIGVRVVLLWSGLSTMANAVAAQDAPAPQTVAPASVEPASATPASEAEQSAIPTDPGTSAPPPVLNPPAEAQEPTQAPHAAPVTPSVTPVQAPTEPFPERPSAERHGAAAVVEIGWYNGLVGGVQLDGGAVGLRASVGYMPILLLARDENLSRREPIDVELISSVQANAELLWLFHATGENSRVGLSAGYHFNSVLKHGVGLAFQGEGALSDAVIVFYTFGVALYWEGSRRASDELGRSNVSFNFPFGAGLQGGGGVGLKFAL